MAAENQSTCIPLANTVMQVVGFNGHIVFDNSMPDGTPQKLLDVSRLTTLGCRARTVLREGIASAYADFRRVHAA